MKTSTNNFAKIVKIVIQLFTSIPSANTPADINTGLNITINITYSYAITSKQVTDLFVISRSN